MTGGTTTMILNWTTFSSNENGFYVVALILMTIGCTALILFNDWCRALKTRKAKSSIAELNVLFAIEDDRETRGYRPSAHR
jgi:hypothetical protein